MHDDNYEEDPARRREQEEDDAALAAYDGWISRCLTTAEWIGEFSMFGAERGDRPKSRQLATAWIRLSRPNKYFLDALVRLGRVREDSKDLTLHLRSPILCDSWMMHCWCLAVTSALTTLLEDEADFISNMLSVGSRTSLTPRRDRH